MRYLRQVFAEFVAIAIIFAMISMSFGYYDQSFNYGQRFNELGQLLNGFSLQQLDSRLIQNPLAERLGLNQNNDFNNEALATAAVSKVTPAVVSVFGVEDVSIEEAMAEDSSMQDGPWASWMPRVGKSFTFMQKTNAGTGFFVDSDGYILTNKHVVAEQDAKYSVVLSSGEKKTAKVVYRDPNNDLAILKVDGHDYPTLDLGDSSRVKVGQTILGIGNAYGKYANTVSKGQVESLRQTVIAGGEEQQRLKNLIQSSAQLYPGDSGGPLFNLKGEVVGINVAIAADREGVSFSIPINDAISIINAVTQS